MSAIEESLERTSRRYRPSASDEAASRTDHRGLCESIQNGRRSGQGGLAPRTVHHMHRILRQALALAVKWDYLARNPADLCGAAEGRAPEDASARHDETAELIAHFRPTRMFMPVLLRALRAPPGRSHSPEMALGRSRSRPVRY